MDFDPMENEAALSNNNMEITIILQGTTSVLPFEIEADRFLKAAADGEIETFRLLPDKQLINDIVTPVKNTVLHINITSKMATTSFLDDILVMCPSLLLQVNARGDTPLHVAARFEHADAVEALIRHAKNQQRHEEVESGVGGVVWEMLRMENDKGNTALHEAVRKKSIDVVELLVREDPYYPYSPNCDGETPLYIAVENGFLEAVTTMLETFTSVFHEGPNGKTTLHAAARRSDPGLVGKILEKKKSLTKKLDNNGWTALHYAAYYGQLEVTRKLLEHDKSFAYVPDKYRKMLPLHLAACQGYKDVVVDILQCCSDCNDLVDDRGWNLLHFAMATLSKRQLFSLLQDPLVKMLVHEKDANGNTPLHVLALCAKSLLSLDPLGDILDKNIGDFSVVNKQNVNAENVFNNGYPDLLQEIMALQKYNGINGPYTNGLLRLQTKTFDEYLEFVKDTRASHLVVATLIATVTFAAGFTLPGGFIQEGKNEGTAILSENSAFQTFVLADTTALVLSISAVFIYFIASIQKFKKFAFVLEFGCWFTVVAMGAMVVAFVTGTYAMISPAVGLAIVDCLNGLSFFLLVLPLGFFLIMHFIKIKSPMRDIFNEVLFKILRWIKEGKLHKVGKLLSDC